MECKDIEAVLEQEGLSPLPQEAREHLADCEGCRELLADLSAIAVAAKRLPAEENPPARIWVSLRAQLEAERVIRQPSVKVEPTGASWWQGFTQILRPRALAMAGAGVLAVAGALYYLNHPAKNVASSAVKSAQPAPTVPSPTAVSPVLKEQPVAAAATQTTSVPNAGDRTKKQAGGIQVARVAVASGIHESNTPLRPSPSELASFGESAATLNQTERAMPSGGWANNAEVEVALRSNLRTLNEFIKECETRLKENPRDQLTQEYLNMALQQKAELLNAMMESGRSEH